MPDKDYLLRHLDHHHTSPEAGSYISQRPPPSREVFGGDELSTTKSTISHDGITFPIDINNVNVNINTATTSEPMHGKMLFSDLYKNPKSPLSKLRHPFPHPIPVLPPGLDEDLVSRDKAKQKEAVKRFLAERVRCDWEFNWPPLQQQPAVQLQDVVVDVAGAPSENAIRTSSDHASTNPISATSSEHHPVEPDIVTAQATVAADTAAASSPAPAPVVPMSLTASPTPDTELLHHPPSPGSEADSETDSDDATSIYSTVSEDALHFRPRAEWSSDLSDSECPPPPPTHPIKVVPILSPFRFDTPDSVGVTVRSDLQARRDRRRREIRAESSWNDGLACYNARRDAWTGARTVRVKPQPTPVTSSPPLSPISPRRLFWRTHSKGESTGSSNTIGTPLTSVVSAPTPTTTSHHHTHTPLFPTTTHLSGHSTTSSSDANPCQQVSSNSTTTCPCPPTQTQAQTYPVETLLPIPAPLLPPQNPMRASITPQIYPSLYDKVVVHSLQPSCPVNLADMVASCVAGWKRDGEWPPRSAPQYALPQPQPAPVATRAAANNKPTGGGGGNSVLVVRRKKSAAGGGEEKGHGRRMSFGALLGLKEKEKEGERKSEEGKEGEKEKEDEGDESPGKKFRRSLHKVFSGLGHPAHHGEHQGHHEAVGQEKAAM
ncbi:hypothetical protein GE09DRAFT_1150490 [Coniochaeta sp. 2T2.1]|nr:hypothetical protein GE09DRAFT_1150490 [Coniochaeta sp. 2T2.1]